MATSIRAARDHAEPGDDGRLTESLHLVRGLRIAHPVQGGHRQDIGDVEGRPLRVVKTVVTQAP